MFPDHISKTLPNLIQFVLRHGAVDLRIGTAVDICARPCIRNNLQSVRREISKLRRRKFAITRRIMGLNHLREANKPGQAVVPKGAFKRLWTIISKVQQQIKTALSLQSYLSRNPDNLPKETLRNYFPKIFSSSQKEDIKPQFHKHDEL